MQFAFDFGGTMWDSLYVGGNGLISFGDLPNPSGFYDNADFFNSTDSFQPFR